MVHRKVVQPLPNGILRFLDAPFYFQPVSFKQCSRVDFLPAIYFVWISMLTSCHPTQDFPKNYYEPQIDSQIEKELCAGVLILDQLNYVVTEENSR